LRKRVITSKVAPPQTSRDQNPTLSISGAMAAMSPVRMRVAKSDWCPSRSVRSVTCTVRVSARFAGLITLSLGGADARRRITQQRGLLFA
jgi:hypothetical protein